MRPTIALLLLFTLFMVTAGAPERATGGSGAGLGAASCEMPRAAGTPIKGTAGIVVVEDSNAEVTFFTVQDGERFEFRAVVLGIDTTFILEAVCSMLHFGTGQDLDGDTFGDGPTLSQQITEALGLSGKTIMVTQRGILGFKCPGDEGCTGDEEPRNPRRGINLAAIPDSGVLLSPTGTPHISAIANVTLYAVDP
jgi:hypothetical protein